MPSFTEISVPQLARRIGLPDAPVLLDLRIDEDFDANPRLLPGARRVPFLQVADLAPDLAERQVVTICHRGLKISHGAAALLRSAGVQAEVLEGGAVAWAEACQPMIPAEALPQTSHWVTRARPKIDRIACPWLIRRFIDPKAQFLFVPASEVPAVAEKFGALPFDIPDTFWSHRGEACTFDTMLAEWQLETDALRRLAKVIRAADTNRHDLAPEAAGLLAISVGLSRQFRDDLEQLEVGLQVYDALYRWARDGFEEGHDWPTSRGPA